MSKFNPKGIPTVIGIDLAKNTLQLHGVDQSGKRIIKQSLKRAEVLVFFANLTSCLIGMEACAGAHYWARKLTALGHTVRLIAPQFVKPFVKSNKNDEQDAEAICEAVQRPSMRFVAVKSVEQQDVLSLHRIRTLVVAERTAKVNQLRGLLMEYGVIVPAGIHHARREIPFILEDGENELSDGMRAQLNFLHEDLLALDARIAELVKALAQIAQRNEDCQRLLTIPGIGLLTVTAMVATVGDIRQFSSGRELAAWLGLVPRQHSTGGKPRLLGISKRGDTYLRTLLIHGGRAVVRVVDRHHDQRNQWLGSVAARRGKNVAAVAAANKNARIAWALLTRQENYRQAA